VKNKVKGVLLFIIIAFIAGCATNNNLGLNSDDITDLFPDNSNAQSAEEDNLIDMDELIEAFKTALHNDLWYHGNNSSYKGYQNKNTNIEVYVNPLHPELLTIIPDIKLKGDEVPYKGSLGLYFAIYFCKEGDEYSDTIAGHCFEREIEDLRERVIDENVVLIGKGNIQFSTAEKPIFSPITNEKEQALEKIRQEVITRFKEFAMYRGKNNGLCKLYIRDYPHNNTGTYSLIEEENGDVWLTSISVPKSDKTAGANKFVRTNDYSDFYSYTVEQYKKVSFVSTFTIE